MKTINLYKYLISTNNSINDIEVSTISNLLKKIKHSGITTIAGVDGIGKTTLLRSLALKHAKYNKILYLSAENYLGADMDYIREMVKQQDIDKRVLKNIVSTKEPIESLFELKRIINKAIVSERIDVIYIDAINLLYKISPEDIIQRFLEYIDELSISLNLHFIMSTNLQLGLKNNVGKHVPCTDDIGYYIMNQENDRVILLNRQSFWGFSTDKSGNDANGVLSVCIFDQVNNIYNLELRLENRFGYT